MYRNNNPYIYPEYGDRQFAFPFLVGALTGGAAIGLTRPRPIYNVAPQNNSYPYPQPYPSGYGYSYNYNYSYPPYPYYR